MLIHHFQFIILISFLTRDKALLIIPANIL